MTKTASNSSDTEGKTVDDAMAGAGKISANHAELRLDDIEFVKLIKDDGFAETWVVHYQGKKWLHKTYRFRFWWGRMARPLARKWARNEMALCDALRGVPGTVSNYIKVSDQSFMREWVEGIDLGALIWGSASSRAGCPETLFLMNCAAMLKRFMNAVLPIMIWLKNIMWL
jgi:hypothetical protein